MLKIPNNLPVIIFSLVLLIPPFFMGGRDPLIIDLTYIIFGLVLLLIFGKSGQNNTILKKPSTPEIFLVSFLVLTLLSIPLSTSPLTSLAAWFSYLFYSSIFFFASRVKLNTKDVHLITGTILFSSLALSIIGIIIYINGGYSRLTSLFYWPNPFASFLLLALPLGAYALSEVQKKKHHLYPLVTALLIIIGAFFLTGSRGALISLLIVCAIYLFNKPKQSKKNIAIFTVVIAMSASLLTLTSHLKNDTNQSIIRSFSQSGSLDASSNIRLDYWQSAIAIIRDHSLFGTGLGSFAQVYPQYQPNPISSGIYAHNWYLELLSEVGFINFAFLAIFFCLIILKKPLGKRNSNLYLAIHGSVLGFMLHNLVDIGSHYPANSITFWALIGLLSNSHFQESTTETSRRRPVRYTVITLSAFFILVGTILIISDHYANIANQYRLVGDLKISEEYYKRSNKYNNLNLSHQRSHAIILYSLATISKDIESRDTYIAQSSQISKYLLKHEPKNPLNYELRGKINQEQGNYANAMADFKKAISLDKYKPSYYINLINLLIEDGQYVQAKKLINTILNYYPEGVVDVKKMIILNNQPTTSGIEKEINYLHWLKGQL